MIYEPGEDSILLLEEIKKRELEGLRCLDIGTGSGILANKMHEEGGNVTATDINPEASENLNEGIEFIQSDLFEGIEEEYDLIVFNPPYLPGENEEDLDGSEIWNGGVKGIEVTAEMLSQVENYLADGGEALVVASSLSDYEDLMDRFDLGVEAERRLWFETLYILGFRDK